MGDSGIKKVWRRDFAYSVGVELAWQDLCTIVIFVVEGADHLVILVGVISL
jgi:hypothetical protein